MVCSINLLAEADRTSNCARFRSFRLQYQEKHHANAIIIFYLPTSRKLTPLRPACFLSNLPEADMVTWRPKVEMLKSCWEGLVGTCMYTASTASEIWLCRKPGKEHGLVPPGSLPLCARVRQGHTCVWELLKIIHSL